MNQYPEFSHHSGVFDRHVRMLHKANTRAPLVSSRALRRPTWKYLGPLHDLDHLLACQAVERGEQALRRIWLGAVIASVHDLRLDVLQDHGRGWRERPCDGGELRDQRRVHGWLLRRSNVCGPLFWALWRRWWRLLLLLLVKAF